MKTYGLTQKIIMLSAFALLAAGCNKNSDSSSSDGSSGLVGTTSTTSNQQVTPCLSGYPGGGAPVVQYSPQAMATYAITHPLNNPTNISVQVNTSDVGGNQYAGTTYISYQDNGQCYTGSFQALNQVAANDGSANGHQGQNYAVYNKFFNYNGKLAFHGFFEDDYGAILVIVDSPSAGSTGDGLAPQTVNGSIWLKNDAVSQAVHGNIPCWFISTGPYDCRTFLSGDLKNIATTSALTPDQSQYTTGYYPSYNQNDPARGWVILGKFQNLNVSQAFGQADLK